MRVAKPIGVGISQRYLSSCPCAPALREGCNISQSKCKECVDESSDDSTSLMKVRYFITDTKHANIINRDKLEPKDRFL